MAKIALQLFSVRDAMASDPKGTLKKVAEMGYDGVETCGLAGMEPKEFRDYCDSLGLQIPSAHGGIEFVSDPKTWEDYKILGAKYLVIAYSLLADWPGHENHEATYKKLNEALEKSSKEGFITLYHNHELELSNYLDSCYLKYIFKDAPKLMAEPDLCWIACAGIDPADFIKNFGVHCPVLHLKDYKYDKELVVNKDDVHRPEGWKLVPVGSGDIDVKSIMETAEEVGSDWIVVEQDNPNDGLTELECAESSIKWLRSKGY